MQACGRRLASLACRNAKLDPQAPVPMGQKIFQGVRQVGPGGWGGVCVLCFQKVGGWVLVQGKVPPRGHHRFGSPHRASPTIARLEGRRLGSCMQGWATQGAFCSQRRQRQACLRQSIRPALSRPSAIQWHGQLASLPLRLCPCLCLYATLLHAAACAAFLVPQPRSTLHLPPGSTAGAKRMLSAWR